MHDALPYLNRTKTGIEQFSWQLYHPHHLLVHFCYIFCGKALVFLFDTTHTSAALMSAHIINILSTIGTLFVMYLLGTLAQFNRVTLFFLITTTAFSFGVWSYATGPEIYAPNIYFSMLSIYLSFRYVNHHYAGLLVGLVTGIAVSLHLMSILFVITISFIFCYFKRYRTVAYYLLSSGLITIILHLPFIYLAGGITPFMQDIMHFSEGHTNLSIAKAFVYFCAGFSKSLFAPFFMFNIPELLPTLTTLFSTQYLLDDIYLIRNMSPFMTIAMIFLLSFFCFFMSLLLFSKYTKIHFKSSLQKPLTISFLSISMSYIFFMTYSSFTSADINVGNSDFHLFLLYCFWFLISIYIQNAAKHMQKLIVTIPVLIVLINFFGSMMWLSQSNNDLFFKTSSQLKMIATENTLVITDLARNYHPYYTFYNVPGQHVYLSSMRTAEEQSLFFERINNVDGNIIITTGTISQQLYLKNRYHISQQFFNSFNLALKKYSITPLLNDNLVLLLTPY